MAVYRATEVLLPCTKSGEPLLALYRLSLCLYASTDS